MAVTQSHFRFGIDQGTESTHGWYAPEDVNPASGTIRPNLTFLLRFCLQCDATLLSNIDAEFQYRKNGGTWTQITTSTSNVKAVTPTCWADGANTTQRLSGTGTFEASSAGCTVDGISGGTAFDIVASGNGETECALQLVGSDLAVGDLIEFRLTRDGAVLLDAYSVTPSILIAEPIARAKVVLGPFPFPKVDPDRFPSAAAPSDVNQALTGVSVTSALGSVGFAMAATLAGIAVSGAVGLGPTDITVGLTGVSATSAVGTVVAGEAPTLSGVAGTGGTGTLGPSISLGLSGVSGTVSVGTLTATTGGVADLSGVAGTSALGTLAPSESVGLTGSAGTTTLGSVFVAGVPATPQRPRIVRGPFPFPRVARAYEFEAQTRITLSGASVSGDEGDLGSSVSIGLTGVTVTGLRGNIQPLTPGDAVLTGVVGTVGTGTLVATIPRALTGVQSSGAVGTLTPIKSTIDRPISVYGPFPFLPGTEFQFRQRARVAQPVSQSITIILTGNSATLQIGTLPAKFVDRTMAGTSTPAVLGTETTAITVGLTGLPVTVSTGALGVGFGLSGVQSTSQLGTLAQTVAVTLAGLVVSPAVGTVTASANSDASVTLSGHQATVQLGTLVPVLTVASQGVSSSFTTGALGIGVTATGVTVQGLRGSVAAVVAPTLSGQAVSVSVGQLGAQANEDRDVTPTGQAVTTQIGTLVPVAVFGVSGVSGTTATGLLGSAQGLLGVTATGATGTIERSISVGLTGVSVSTAIGTVAAQANSNITVQLSGHQTTGQLGTVSADRSLAETGVQSSSARGSVVATVDRSLAGSGLTSQTGTLGLASSGTAALTGLAATMSIGSVTTEGASLISVPPALGQTGAMSAQHDVELSSVDVTMHTGFFSGPPPVEPDVVIIVRGRVGIIQVQG